MNHHGLVSIVCLHYNVVYKCSKCSCIMYHGMSTTAILLISIVLTNMKIKNVFIVKEFHTCHDSLLLKLV